MSIKTTTPKLKQSQETHEPAEITIFKILEGHDPVAQNGILETVIRMVAAKREEEKVNTSEFAERSAKAYYQFIDTVQGGWQNGMNKTGQMNSGPIPMAKSAR